MSMRRWGWAAACAVIGVTLPACGDDGDVSDSGSGTTEAADSAGTLSGPPITGLEGGDPSEGNGASDSSPSPPEDVRLVVARFDDGVESWSAVGPVDLQPYIAALDPNGDVLVALRVPGDLTDSRLVRVSEGEVVDELVLDGDVWVRSIAVSQDGTIHVAGSFDDRSGHLALDGDFNEHWPLTITSTAGPTSVALAVGPEGSVVYAGWSDELDAPIVSLLDADGVAQWTTTRPGVSEAPVDAGIRGLAVHPNGAIVVALGTGGEDSSMLWLDAFTPDGSPAWAAQRVSTLTGGITVSAAGDFVIAGYEALFGAGEIDEHLWLSAYDTDGAKLWEALSEPVGQGPLHACDDGFVLVRWHGLQAATFDAEGQPDATVSYLGEGSLQGTDAFCTPDGGVIVVGSSTVPE